MHLTSICLAAVVFPTPLAPRMMSDVMSDELINSSDITSLIILGASGVGKTTAARQMLVRCIDKGIICWEHKND
ncbi:hypothetical protein CRN61_31665, partial [Vibrio vulnificus]